MTEPSVSDGNEGLLHAIIGATVVAAKTEVEALGEQHPALREFIAELVREHGPVHDVELRGSEGDRTHVDFFIYRADGRGSIQHTFDLVRGVGMKPAQQYS